MHHHHKIHPISAAPRRLPRALATASVLALALGLAACASTPPPVASMTTARAAITQAEAAGAGQLAPVELLSARDKLVKAESAVREERFDLARRLADEAAVDGQLAERSARLQRAKLAAAEMKRSNATLETETERRR